MSKRKTQISAFGAEIDQQTYFGLQAKGEFHIGINIVTTSMSWDIIPLQLLCNPLFGGNCRGFWGNIQLGQGHGIRQMLGISSMMLIVA